MKPVTDSLSGIPAVQRYGESDDDASLDYLHVESLITRSRQHQFRIRPHRHPGLTQIFYLRSGSGEARIDGQRLTLQAPMLILISPMSVHDFIWSDAVAGWVISVAAPRLEQTRRALQRETLKLAGTALLPLPPRHASLERVLQQLVTEYRRAPDACRDLALQAAVDLLAIELERLPTAALTAEAGEPHRGSELFRAYQQRLNEDYKTHRPLASYATELGITAPYLNQLCKQLSGYSAQQLLHQRLLLEARRLLRYTAMRVSEIAYQLGFSDPAYFTRFFRRLNGTAPLSYRREHQAKEASDHNLS